MNTKGIVEARYTSSLQLLSSEDGTIFSKLLLLTPGPPISNTYATEMPSDGKPNGWILLGTIDGTCEEFNFPAFPGTITSIAMSR